MCIANSRECSSKMKYLVALKRARDYYFKMTLSSFIIINHMRMCIANSMRVFENKIHEDPEFPSCVIFSDKSLFTRKGIFNSNNMHMWDEENLENPRVTRLRNYQVCWMLNVWAGIMDIKILGPVILPERHIFHFR